MQLRVLACKAYHTTLIDSDLRYIKKNLYLALAVKSLETLAIEQRFFSFFVSWSVFLC